MAEKLYKFEVNSRHGSLESVFAASEDQIAWIVGKDIYFGEVWGKHSNVELTIMPENLTVISDDPRFIQLFKDHVGLTGSCPFNHLNDEQGEEYDELFPEESK